MGEIIGLGLEAFLHHYHCIKTRRVYKKKLVVIEKSDDNVIFFFFHFSKKMSLEKKSLQVNCVLLGSFASLHIICHGDQGSAFLL